MNDRIISDCIQALEKYNAVDVAIKTTDTIIQVNEKEYITGIPVRENLRNGQTPQAFKLSTIKKHMNWLYKMKILRQRMTAVWFIDICRMNLSIL